jgi:glutathione S-transferase
VTITLWDLCGAETDRRFSPYCWRTKLALHHKGLAYTTIPWRMIDKHVIGFSGQGKVPVIKDGETIVTDSWDIANYLEDTYPDRPSLFAGPGGRGTGRFVADWAELALLAGIFPMIAVDLHSQMDAETQIYFRKTREKFLGRTLEAAQAERETLMEQFRRGLIPLRRMLKFQNFISGETPAWHDYAAFSVFQWARCTSPLRLLAEDDPVYAWREHMLDLYDGLARQAMGYAV